MLNKIRKDWKTSLSSLLTVALTLTGSLLVPGVQSLLTSKEVKYLLAAQAFAKIWVGFLQQDAGVVEAKVPGEPGTKMVPAHETPDSPQAIPVAEETHES